jgi:chemotaxis protein methyltransferase CheR
MEPEVYLQIKFNVKKLLDINLDHYKDEQMRRRLDSWLVRSGISDWNTYIKRLRSDAIELSRFRDYLTINVSAFFRDTERWRSLEEDVLPTLLQTCLRLRPRDPGLRVWSAGCSIGAEAYTLAMLLRKVSPVRRHHLLATDLDRSALARSRDRGPYSAEEIQNLTSQQRVQYLDPGGPPYFVKSDLTRQIEFREHDMLKDPFPADQDLVVCRNVVIYFTAETKDSLYTRFFQALRPGGILFVGATEIVPRPHEIGFRSVGISFYQRINL